MSCRRVFRHLAGVTGTAVLLGVAAESAVVLLDHWLRRLEGRR